MVEDMYIRFSITSYGVLNTDIRFINCKPQHYLPEIIQKMKGTTSRILMKENREILREQLWGGNLWTPSYFVATVSENTEEQIRKYIKNQKAKVR